MSTMISIGLVLLIFAIVCFGVAASGMPTGRVNATALGLFFLSFWFLLAGRG